MLDPDIVEVVYNYNTLYSRLSAEVASALLEGAPSSKPIEEIPLQDRQYQACLWAYYQQSQAQAKHLGYQEHPDAIVWPLGRPAVIVAVIKPKYKEGNTYPNFTLEGFANQVTLVAHAYGLLEEPKRYHDPDLMWDLIDWRRDGDAIVFLAGDDRDYTHFVGVVWSPERLQGDATVPHAIV